MLKMIVADDEPVIIRGIRMLLDWQSLGIEIVGEYEDGKSTFEGILKEKPEIALLDISMPGKTGIQILKELRELKIDTKVIFISGFQEFTYAQAALTYGAQGYLLKPVIKEELIACVEKSLASLEAERKISRREESAEREEADYGRLIELEETTYLPVYAELFFDGQESRQERKLMLFAFTSYLEEYLEHFKLGILFKKNENLVLVLKGVTREQGWEKIERIRENVKQSIGKDAGFILGNQVSGMGEIPLEYSRCLEKKGYFFFRSQLALPVLYADGGVFKQQPDAGEFQKCSREICSVFAHCQEERLARAWKSCVRQICLMSDGRKEDACYHFCSLICTVEKTAEELGLPVKSRSAGELLEEGRKEEDYERLTKRYFEILRELEAEAAEGVSSGGKKEISIAKRYIREHYRENLTLEVLAGEVHMNPCYFSNFFKKHAGEGFKEYVNRVRLEHAVKLLLTSDLKKYEIAAQAGFRDARAFTNAFVQEYRETPGSYKKRMSGRGKDDL